MNKNKEFKQNFLKKILIEFNYEGITNQDVENALVVIRPRLAELKYKVGSANDPEYSNTERISRENMSESPQGLTFFFERQSGTSSFYLKISTDVVRLIISKQQYIIDLA